MKLHERLRLVRQSRLDMSAKAVLFALASYLSSEDEEQPAWPSQATLAEDAGCSRSTIATILDRLQSAGVIVVTKRAAQGRSARRTIDWGRLAEIPAKATSKQVTKRAAETDGTPDDRASIIQVIERRSSDDEPKMIDGRSSECPSVDHSDDRASIIQMIECRSSDDEPKMIDGRSSGCPSVDHPDDRASIIQTIDGRSGSVHRSDQRSDHGSVHLPRASPGADFEPSPPARPPPPEPDILPDRIDPSRGKAPAVEAAPTLPLALSPAAPPDRGARARWNTGPKPVVVVDHLADGSIWGEVARTWASLTGRAVPMDPTSGVGRTLAKAVETHGERIRLRIRYFAAEPGRRAWVEVNRIPLNVLVQDRGKGDWLVGVDEDAAAWAANGFPILQAKAQRRGEFAAAFGADLSAAMESIVIDARDDEDPQTGMVRHGHF